MEFETLVKVYEKIDKTSKRLEKVSILADFLSKLDDNEIYYVMLLLKGRVFEDWNRKDMGISSKMMLKVISVSSGLDIKKIIDVWKQEGDLGIASMKILSKNQQKTLFRDKLMINQVVEDLRKISNLSGHGSSELKIKLLSKLLSDADPLEIKYIVRTVLEDLRTGASDGVIRDAIKLAFLEQKVLNVDIIDIPEVSGSDLVSENSLDFKKGEESNSGKGNTSKKDKSKLDKSDSIDVVDNSLEILQNAIDLTSDLGEVALLAKKGLDELKNVKPKIYKPLRLMLFPKTDSFENIFKNLGKKSAFEYKYDGFRVQIHKGSKGIKIFTRRLDDVTTQFPDIVACIDKNIKTKNFILDCEIVGYDSLTGDYLPFQSISQRIKRKYNIDEVAKKFPVEVIVFDVLYLDDESYLKTKFKDRRKILNNLISDFPKKICLSKYIETSSVEEATNFYRDSLNQGFEGIMAKSLDSYYIPGRKVGAGFKLKPIMQELDLVITKAEWGTGKRSRWLTSFTLSCIDDDGTLLEIGKVSSGLKELESEDLSYSKLTELILPLIIFEKGKEIEIKPEIIIEVNFEEIQKSPTYSSGFALRFPRIIRLRDDKGLDELTDINQIEKLYLEQKGRN